MRKRALVLVALPTLALGVTVGASAALIAPPNAPQHRSTRRRLRLGRPSVNLAGPPRRRRDVLVAGGSSTDYLTTVDTPPRIRRGVRAVAKPASGD